MGHCKDCRFWISDNDIRFGKVIEWNECNAIDMAEKRGRVPGSGAIIYADAADDTGLSAVLMTGPLFGCVFFKQRTEETEDTEEGD